MDITKPELEALVADATKAATQEVAARNRRRLRVESILIGVIVTCLVAIPTTKLVAHHNATVNCHLITKLAALGDKTLHKEKVKLHEFETKSRDRFGLNDADFKKLVLKGRQENYERQLVLEEVAHHNCG